MHQCRRTSFLTNRPYDGSDDFSFFVRDCHNDPTYFARCTQEGQILVDHSIWVLILIVFGGVVLVFGKDFLTNTLMPTVGEKIMSFMN